MYVCISSPEEFTENKDLIEDYAGGILALDAVQNEVEKASSMQVILHTEENHKETLMELMKQKAVGGLSGAFVSASDTDLTEFKELCRKNGIPVNISESAISWSEFKLNSDGLIPVVVQDYKTDEVLMLAYMNAESLRMTMELGEAVYYSRSRQEIWHKGATSGHVQKVKQILVDCDQDALIVLVDQCGAGACHTGHHSCFYRSVPFGDELKAQPQGGAVTLREADGGVVFDAEAVYGKGH